MFKKKLAYVELSAETPTRPVKVAGAELKPGEALPFELAQDVTVRKVSLTREGDTLAVSLGTDDGHYILITVKG